mgnify:CR=1 FL=1
MQQPRAVTYHVPSAEQEFHVGVPLLHSPTQLLECSVGWGTRTRSASQIGGERGEGEERKEDDCVDRLFERGEIVLAEGVVFPLEGCITEIGAEGIGCRRIVRGKGFLIGYFFIWIKVLQV